MPDQTNQNNPNPQTPVTSGNPPNDTTPTPIVPDFQTVDIPPLPSGTSANNPPSTGDPGDTILPDTPPLISTPPKKKFGAGKIIATILGFLILAGGIAGGVILTQQQQDIREKAANFCGSGTVCRNYSSETSCSISGGTWKGVNGCYIDPRNSLYGTCCVPIENVGTSTPTPTTPPPDFCGSGKVCRDYVSQTSCNLVAGNWKTCWIDPRNNETGTCCVPIENAGTSTPSPTRTSTPVGGGGCTNPAWPSNGTSCSTVGGQSGTIGGCITYYCPNGCGGDGKCDERDSGVYTRRSSSCSTAESTLGNQCGQIDTVNQGGTYCIASGCYKESKTVCQSTCVRPPAGPTPTGGGTTAQCLNVKAYNTSWVQLTATQLSTLRAGDRVRFTISGTPADKYDKAKFFIVASGSTTPSGEVTQKKPGTDEFYYEYTIRSTDRSVTVNAQIHHITQGWSTP